MIGTGMVFGLYCNLLFFEQSKQFLYCLLCGNHIKGRCGMIYIVFEKEWTLLKTPLHHFADALSGNWIFNRAEKEYAVLT